MSRLPAHLAKPYSVRGRTYGTLYKEQGQDNMRQLWCIAGEPQVIQLAKRLFPGSSGKKGIATFPASRRILGDLNWLMIRYPLDIDDEDAWREDFQQCIEHTLKSMDIAEHPQRTVPPETTFNGVLHNFQEEGLAWMLHHRRTLLADEMGLGKTVQFLAFLASSQNYPAIVVMQPHLIKQWCRSAERFLPGITYHVIKGLKPYVLPECHIHLIHYGLLRDRGWKQVLPGRYRTVCFDEIQELRHHATQKYSAASLLAEGADGVVGLSGTPIHNAGGEIWNVLNILEMHCLGDWDSFTREWCAGYRSLSVMEPDLLGNRLREEGLMIRRTKAEVLPELPPKRRVVEEIDADEGIFGQLIAPAIEMACKLDSIEDILAKGRVTREIVNSVRQAAGISKAPYVATFTKALLEAGESCLLFAHHHKVVDLLLEILGDWKPGCVTGRQSKDEKDDSVRRFQEGETQLCILSLRTCSGLDLYAAKCVVFAELDWSPAVHAQAEDRAHRMGTQHDSILAYYLVWNGLESSDPDMMESLGFKTSQFKGLMGDPDETEEDRMLARNSAKEHIAKIIARIKRRSGRKNISAVLDNSNSVLEMR